MDWNAVSHQLDDVPATFKRTGATYAWLFNSFVIGLLRYTSAADGTIRQLTFQNALGTWLDTWGQLFNFRRNNNESDGQYALRIQFLLLSGKGPSIAIEKYIQVVEGLTAIVFEHTAAGFEQVNGDTEVTGIGYQIQIGLQTLTQYSQIVNDLKFVRPAGVPFLPLLVLRGGLYLGTINYLGTAPSVTGAYLVDPISEIRVAIPAATNNSVPLLPTTFLTDPTLNPT